MKKIYILYNPVLLDQKILVYDNAENREIESKTFRLESFCPNDLFSLVEKYDISEIEVIGPRAFTHRQVLDLKEKELTRYSCNKLNFHLN